MRHLRSCALIALALFTGGCAADYDLVLEGGRVIDPESGFDQIANVGIVGDEVTAVSTEPLSGARTIDASGLVVAPGFVDLHRHGQSDEGYRLQVHDGVTTGLELEIGTANVADWYAEREGGQLVNYGVAQGHVGARVIAMGDDPMGMGMGSETNRQASTPEQQDELERLIREGIENGAIGIGFGTAYTPGATMDEVERMMSIAADHAQASFVHMRNGVPGLDSTITAARDAGSALHIVHANSSGGNDVEAFLGLIQEAQRAGQDVTTEAYPYAASQTGIESALFDDWETWEDEQFGIYQWVRTGERLTRDTFAQYRAEGGSVIIHSRTEEQTLYTITHPVSMVASDGGIGHPRGAGTFGKVLGRYVREQGEMELVDALGRMTYLPAERLRSFVPEMAEKGRIGVGSDADITVFDPETVIDNATYLEGSLLSSGFEYVIVNGVVVIDGGELVDGVRPGRAVKGQPR